MAKNLSIDTVSHFLSHIKVIFGWFSIWNIQERLEKLLQKYLPGGGDINGHFGIFTELFLMYLDSISTSHPTFVINQLHFIPRVSVQDSFYQCFSCSNETFLAPLIARFIVWSHFSTMSACSELHVPCTISPAYCLIFIASGIASRWRRVRQLCF